MLHLLSPPSFVPHPWQPLIFILTLSSFLFFVLHIKRIMQYVLYFFLFSGFFSSVKYYQGSSMLCMCQNQNSVSLKGTIIFHFVDITHFIDSFFCWRNVGLFCSLSVMKNDAMLFLPMQSFKAAIITKHYLSPIFQPHTKGYFIDFMSHSHSTNQALFK